MAVQLHRPPCCCWHRGCYQLLLCGCLGCGLLWLLLQLPLPQLLPQLLGALRLVCAAGAGCLPGLQLQPPLSSPCSLRHRRHQQPPLAVLLLLQLQRLALLPAWCLLLPFVLRHCSLG